MGCRQGGVRGHYNNLNFFLLWSHTHTRKLIFKPRVWGGGICLSELLSPCDHSHQHVGYLGAPWSLSVNTQASLFLSTLPPSKGACLGEMGSPRSPSSFRQV